MEIENVTIKSEQIDEDDIIEDKINIKEEGLQSTNETPYKCGICGHRTTTDTLLKVHMKMHLVKRLHQCNICKKTFSFVTELNSHILTHTEEKNSYQCEVCRRDCFTEEDLHKHYRVHTKEKPFKCKLCFRSFSDDSYLRVHERTHHGEDYFKNVMKKNGTFVDPNLVKNVIEDSTPKDFKCDICQKCFCNEEFLKLHIENHLSEGVHHDIFGAEDPLATVVLPTDISDKYLENCRTTIPVDKQDPSSFECEYTDDNGKKCSRRFGEKEAYDIHVKTHENSNSISCRLCKIKFADDSELSAHMLGMHGTFEPDKLGLEDNMIRCKEMVKGKEKTVFRCTICTKHFPVPSKLRSHMRTHTGEKPFKCDVCNKSFGTAGSLKDHGYLHTNKKPYNCTICEKGFTKNSALEDHIRSHTGERPYECNICKKRYRTIVILNQHLLAHAKEKPFKCDVCNKSFIYLCNLKYHMVTHTGSKPFACSLCDRSYSIKNALKIHMMDHRGEKPFKCRFCDKQFTAGNSLKKHERIHTGEKPYICSVCKKGFSQSSSLSRHLDSHKGEKPYRCTVCQRGFTSASYLKIHLKMHQGEPPYQCKQCNEKFMVVQKYRVHLKQHKKGKNDGNPKSKKGKTVDKEENENSALKSEIEDEIEIKKELDEN
ncbi:zinc finger protein 708-like [Anoplophora glabripennis]|uniref:zinc finger protein 708-like n=1 Tax=Anoplophora glabripennis TaxID=217634 RepID=UPI0008740A76|nr:zinc finger protein 708-like [Anoplophora glabripennis]